MTNDDKTLVERLLICAPFDQDQADAADRIEALSAENELLRLHLDVALETLAEEGVCGDECITCKEARAALGEQQ